MEAFDAFSSLLNQTTGIRLSKKNTDAIATESLSIKNIEKFVDEELPFDRYIDPWKHSNAEWSDEAIPLRNLHRKNLESTKPKSYTSIDVLSHFKTLRMHNMKINQLDSEFSEFPLLEELSLTGNLIKNVNNLPKSLLILHLNANDILKCPDLHYLYKLLHVGLGYNQIQQVSHAILWLPATLISLDLSFNNLYDLQGTVDSLKSLSQLKSLVLIGNPIKLAGDYTSKVVHTLGKLTNLDDEPISNAFRKNLVMPNDSHSSLATLQIQVKEVTGIQRYDSQSVTSPDQPSNEFKYIIHIGFESLESKVSTNSVAWKPDLIEFNETLKDAFPIDVQTKETWTRGISIQLLQEKYQFVQESPVSTPAPESAPKKNDKGGGAAAGKKGKPEIVWKPKLLQTIPIAYGKVSLKHFLDSNVDLTVDTHLFSVSNPNLTSRGSIAATVRLNFHLN